MLLQKLPDESADSDAWNRLLHLASTTSDEELLDLKAEKLLYRLFHEEDLRLFDADVISFACSCSPRRTRDMLISLGKSEVEETINEQNQIIITCEFCNAQYSFDSVDLKQIFLDNDHIEPSTTRH